MTFETFGWWERHLTQFEILVFSKIGVDGLQCATVLVVGRVKASIHSFCLLHSPCGGGQLLVCMRPLFEVISVVLVLDLAS